MKKLSLIGVATLLVLAFCINSCKKNGTNDPTVKQEVNFSFAEKTLKTKTLKGKEDATAVLVTITKLNGDPVLVNGVPVFVDKVLKLYTFGSSTISESISLEVGEYKLTKFVVLANTTALYATPLEGSPNANLVADPLPITFTVAKDQVTKVIPEVLAINQSSPADFGYASFDFQIVETIVFRMCAQIYNSSIANWELSSANVSISGTSSTNSNAVSVYTGAIDAITSVMTIKGTYDSYTIHVSKEGNSVVKIVSKAELQTYASNPLIFSFNETVSDCAGNVYHTVQIGTQVWMLENLKTTCYRNGDPIPNLTDNAAWFSVKSTGAYCWYNNNISNKDLYGALYNWYTVVDPRNIAPIGWHVPTDDEWTTLITYLGGESVAGGKLKATTNWDGVHTNESGFTALKTGYRNCFSGKFDTIDAHFWSSTDKEEGFAYYLHLYNNDPVSYTYGGMKRSGFSVRCIKD